MGYIGKVILQVRKEQKVSRKALADGICSEKYIYLIEKNERNPSAELVRQFGDRLGVDFFEAYEFLECKYPLTMAKQMAAFERLRSENNQEELKRLSDILEKDEDYKRVPWSFEITLNRISYEVFVEQKIEPAVKKMEAIRESLDVKDVNEWSYGEFLILLSTAYQIMQNVPASRVLIDEAMAIVERKKGVFRYRHLQVVTYVNWLTLDLLTEDYEHIIELGTELYTIQMNGSYYEQLHHTLFYLACAHYQLGHKEEAVDWFCKTLYLGLIRPKQRDFYYFTHNPIFLLLYKEEGVSKDLKMKFEEIYEMQLNTK